MRFTKLALASAMLAASISANAAWQPASANNPNDGEMILSIWNTSNERSLTVDLGVLGSTMVNEELDARSWTLDPADVQWLGSGDIYWNIAGGASYIDLNTYDPQGWGYYITATDGITPRSGQPFTESTAQFVYFEEYSARLPGLRDYETGDISENLTYRAEGAATYAGNGVIWGQQQGGLATWFGMASIAEADEIMYGWTADFIGTDFSGLSVEIDDKFWQLDLASNTLYYATPVPAAAWLFGSALLGLAGAVRRRRVAA